GPLRRDPWSGAARAPPASRAATARARPPRAAASRRRRAPRASRRGHAAPCRTRARPSARTPLRGPRTTSSQALRDVVERERALERVADAEQRVLCELRADELQADRQALREPARDRQAGQPCHARRDRE